MNIEWKPMKIVNVKFGTIVFIPDPNHPEDKDNILDNIYMVMDESQIVPEDEIETDKVYVVDMEDGTIYKADIDMECFIIEGARLHIPQHIKNQIN
jgi:hypothetical protein